MDKEIFARNEITEGVIWKQLLKFFFPILFGSIFQQLYITADAVIVGKFVGENALASVGGATSSIINLIVGFFIGLASGASVIIAQYYSAKRGAETSEAVHTVITAGVVAGAVVTVFGVLFSRQMLVGMKTPEEILGEAEIYLKIYFGGTVFNMLYNMGAGILQAVGDSKRPLYILVCATVANIILDLIFVVTLKMGIDGAAWATILSQAVSAVLVLVVLARSKECYRFRLSKIKIDFKILKRIIKIGIPTAVQSSMFSISNLIIQSAINVLGSQVVAAWTAYGRIDSAYWMTMNAFSIAATTFSAQNFAVGKPERVRKSVRVSITACMITAAVFALILLPFSRYIYMLFLENESTIEIGQQMIYVLVPFYCTYIFTDIFSAAIRGTGQTFIPMLISVFGICVTRVVWLQIFPPIYNTLNSVILVYPITWSLTSLIFTIYYFKGKWLKPIEKSNK